MQAYQRLVNQLWMLQLMGIRGMQQVETGTCLTVNAV